MPVYVLCIGLRSQYISKKMTLLCILMLAINLCMYAHASQTFAWLCLFHGGADPVPLVPCIVGNLDVLNNVSK
jgi:hypothetical protein